MLFLRGERSMSNVKCDYCHREFESMKREIGDKIFEIMELTIIKFNVKYGGLFRGHKYEFHNVVQNRIKYLAKHFSLKGTIEYRVEKYDGKRNGLIDVVWLDEDNNPIVAIELDSSPRERSVKKLDNIDCPIKIWLYYGIKESNEAMHFDLRKPIYLIHYPVKFNSKE
jgi:hypothetical protein